MTSKKQQLNTAQACLVFGVSSMTLHNWRKGTQTLAPLPVIAKEAELGRIRYNPSVLKTWASKNKVIIARTPEEVLAAGSTKSQGKPGPKPRQVETCDVKELK